MLKKSMLVLFFCSILVFQASAQYESRSYIFTSTFEEDQVGLVPTGWRSVYPLSDLVQIKVTDDADKVSPFTDIFPQSSKSVLCSDEDSTKALPGAPKTNSLIFGKDIKTDPKADFFLSFDFKILRGGNLVLFLYSPGSQYLTRIRIVENRPLEIYVAPGQFEKPNFVTKRGQWYRLQLIVNRTEGTMDLAWQTEDGTSETFKGVKLLNPLPGQAIGKVWFVSTVGDGSETGSWVVDNVFAQELR